jgi:hypothetical protein
VVIPRAASAVGPCNKRSLRGISHQSNGQRSARIALQICEALRPTLMTSTEVKRSWHPLNNDVMVLSDIDLPWTNKAVVVGGEEVVQRVP